VPDELVNVRCMVDDVEDAVAFYTNHFGFTLRSSAAPAFAEVVRGNLRLVLSGPKRSAGRPMSDGRTPALGGWNASHRRGHRGRRRSVARRGPDVPKRHRQRAGRAADPARGPAGNPIELFQPAGAEAPHPRAGDRSGPVRDLRAQPRPRTAAAGRWRKRRSRPTGPFTQLNTASPIAR
jgi:catechol 2,3-dioxygenase-like lactoylglutathione lyase family enzyme